MTIPKVDKKESLGFMDWELNAQCFRYAYVEMLLDTKHCYPKL
jgi:hypothetical protein